jgi:Protein of unknown function (DUF3025)
LIQADTPWLAPFEAWLPLPLHGLHEALNAHQGRRQFVAATQLPKGEAYESFVARSGCVPTRVNLHDAFNALVWLAEPALKEHLNALQAEAIAEHGVGPQRGPVRDAITLLDEYGAVWPDCPPAIAAAWRQRDWFAMFVTHRALWQHSRPRLVGHALLEQLHTAPRKGLTAHVLLAEPVALAPADWRTRPLFLPLPVLGVPGWWAANADPAFYDDPLVFRPLREVTA